ncbi:acetyl-CoA carboxylase, biotin carboxyl carrier protein [Enterococcus canis]|uniref:Biotin carboxyl carrier protein of acetyl-CoA carboxylase n=1 Tax=Enterococcus canis TaxID=214095 RepID=A0A1L8RCY2_9ENTE|nr:acetyl-CoA carboxylase biotin carboxyl carrier protein [Enterococcus canis]OJG17584.1 acetyl-CoA carboxylase, biotin carboxyl carrier protein [Enterococcus canis]
MQFQEIQALIEQFDRSGLSEFALEDGSFSLALKKASMTTHSAPVEATTVPIVPTVSTVEPVAAPAPVAGALEIAAPLVGVAYLKPAPDKPDFVTVGSHVSEGDVVCIVEAMKIMNEITSPYTGTVTEILIEDEDVVSYNQPLFKIAEDN